MTNKTKKVLVLSAVGSACALTIAVVIVSEVLKATVWEGTVPYSAKLMFEGAQRLLLSVAAIGLIVAMGFTSLLRPRIRGGVLPSIAGLAVALANFPFFCLADGSLVVTADAGGMTLFVAYCFTVGLFEETAFRGFVLPALLDVFKDKKHGDVIAVICSSGIFALVHLLNLFQGASVGGTLLQVGYTFLVGCMCAVIMLATRSLLMPVVIHALFDVGGIMVASGAASGAQWSTPAIAVMAVVSVISALYLTFWFFRHRNFTCEKLLYT